MVHASGRLEAAVMAQLQFECARELQPGLYVVATPIGNLSDITLRALAILAGVEMIYCEDTRHSARLLRHYGVDTPTMAYHDHNGAAMRPQILERLRKGARFALISDAGTPLVSDPGYKLVEAVLAEALPVIPIPGPSAVLAALTMAGLPTDQFLFAGFPPAKQKARRERLESLKAAPATLVFYESPHRLGDLLQDLEATGFGDRKAVVAREITKRFEASFTGLVRELVGKLALEGNPKGEVVLMIAPPGEAAPVSQAEMDAVLLDLMKTASLKDAARIAAAQFGIARKQAYERGLLLKQEDAE